MTLKLPEGQVDGGKVTNVANYPENDGVNMFCYRLLPQPIQTASLLADVYCLLVIF